MKLNRFLITTSMIICVSLQYVVAEDSSQWSLPENAVARFGKGQITDLAYSPDGKLLAVGTSIGTWLYDPHTGKEVALLTGHTFSEMAQFQRNLNYSTYDTFVAFSPEGKTLASSCWDGNVRLWDVPTRKHKVTQKGNRRFVQFLSDGKTLVCASYDFQLRNAHNLELKKKYTFTEEYGDIVPIALSPDGQTLAIKSNKHRTIYMWDLKSGTHKVNLAGNTTAVKALAFSPDGSIFASGGFGNTVRLWDAKTGKRQKTLIGHTGTVRVLAFSPDGETFASGSWDKTVRLWDINTRKHMATLTGHKGTVEHLAFSPNGNTLASGSSDGTIMFWDIQTGQQKTTLTHTQFRSFRSPMVLSSDGKTLVSTENKDILLWDIHTTELKTRLSSDMGHRYSIHYSQDGTTLANHGYWEQEKQFLLWNVLTGKRREPFTEQHSDIFSETVSRTLSPDGSILAVGKVDGTVQLWNTHSGEHKATLSKNKGWVSAAAFSSDGRLLATGDHNHTIHLWEAHTGTHKATFTFSTGYGAIGALVFSPDASALASTNADDLNLWNLNTGDNIQTLGHKAANALAFSPDGKILASGSRDTTVRLWNTQTGHLYDTLIGHTGEITSLAFQQPERQLKKGNLKGNNTSQNDYTLASLSRDETVLLWNVKPVFDTKAVVNIRPHLVESPAVGEQLTFNINISSAKNITGCQITMDFDTTSLCYVSSKNGDYLSGETSAEVTHIYPNRVKLLSTTSTEIGHGDGTLTSVTFEVIDQKASTLSLPEVRLEKSDGRHARPTVKGSTVFDPKQRHIDPAHYTEMGLPEGATARLGKGSVNDMKFSPDNTQLAVATTIGIWIYDANTGDEIAFITEHESEVEYIVFSPDGNLFVSSGRDGTIRFWNTHTYQLLKTFKSSSDPMVFSPDGGTLISGQYLWDIHAGQQIAAIIRGNIYSDYIPAVSPDGKKLATTTRENNIRLWDVHNGRELALLNNERNISGQHKILFSPDGTKLAAIGSERNLPNSTILLWNAHTHELLSSYTERDNSKVFLSIDYSPEGDLLTVVKDWHRTLHIHNYETDEEIAVLKEHDERVDVTTFSPDKTTLATAEVNGTIRLWNIESGELLMKLKGGVHVPASIALSPDGSTLAMPKRDKGLQFWDRYKNRIVTFPLKSDEDDFWTPNAFAFSPDWKIIAAGEWQTIRLWDTTTENISQHSQLMITTLELKILHIHLMGGPSQQNRCTAIKSCCGTHIHENKLQP